MKNSKHLNVGLSITAIACAFMMLLSYEGLAALLTFIPGEAAASFDWKYACTYLIFLVVGLAAMLMKFICCSIKNLKDNKKTPTYSIVSLIIDCLCTIGFVLILAVFFLRAAEVTEAGESIFIMYCLAAPLTLVGSICGLFVSKRCYN